MLQQPPSSMLLPRHPSFDSIKGFHKEVTTLKGALGYWGDEGASYRSGENAGLPTPHDFVDTSWDATERARVVAHLKAAPELVQWRGSSWCRFKCGEQYIGSRCLTDGVYSWPSGFAHYVEVHGVKPPQEFIDHVLGKQVSP